MLAKCDMLDGVKDGLLENPTRCTFDPKEIECRDGLNCLTTVQIEAVGQICARPTNPRTHEQISSPLYRGSELDAQRAILVLEEQPSSLR